MQNWPRNPENSRLDGIFDAFAAGGIVSGSFSCGDRPVYVADSPGFYGSNRIRKRVRVALAKRSVCWSKAWSRRFSSWATAACVVPIAFATLPRHGPRQIPSPGATPARALGGDVFPALVPSSLIQGRGGLSLISRFPKHGSMNYVCQKDGLLLFSNRSSC